MELASRFGDGPGLQTYLGSSPWTSRDEMGLYEDGRLASPFAAINQAEQEARDAHRGVLRLLGHTGTLGFAGSMYYSLFAQYAANLEADVEWASDWSQPDDAYSRTSSRWVLATIGEGAILFYAQDFEEEGEESADDAETSGRELAMGVRLPPHVGPVQRTIPLGQYVAAKARYKAMRMSLWSKELKNNAHKYASDSRQRVAQRLNPRSKNGELMVIHHKKPIARGGDPVCRENLRFIPAKTHVKVHGKTPYGRPRRGGGRR